MKTVQKFNLTKWSFMLVFLAISMLTYAQKGEKRKIIKEKIESQKVAFITQQLALTTDEAKVFWPVYNEYEAKKETLTKEFREVNKPLKDKGLDQMTNEEASAFIDNQFVHAQKMLDLKKEYVAKFKKVIPVKKVATLQKAEKEFKKDLVKKVRERRKGKMQEKEE